MARLFGAAACQHCRQRQADITCGTQGKDLQCLGGCAGHAWYNNPGHKRQRQKGSDHNSTQESSLYTALSPGVSESNSGSAQRHAAGEAKLDVQEQPAGVLHDLLDALEEGDPLAAVDQAVVVRQRHVHNWPRQYLLAYHLRCAWEARLLWLLLAPCIMSIVRQHPLEQ